MDAVNVFHINFMHVFGTNNVFLHWFFFLLLFRVEWLALFTNFNQMEEFIASYRIEFSNAGTVLTPEYFFGLFTFYSFFLSLAVNCNQTFYYFEFFCFVVWSTHHISMNDIHNVNIPPTCTISTIHYWEFFDICRLYVLTRAQRVNKSHKSAM